MFWGEAACRMSSPAACRVLFLFLQTTSALFGFSLCVWGLFILSVRPGQLFFTPEFPALLLS